MVPNSSEDGEEVFFPETGTLSSHSNNLGDDSSDDSAAAVDAQEALDSSNLLENDEYDISVEDQSKRLQDHHECQDYYHDEKTDELLGQELHDKERSSIVPDEDQNSLPNSEKLDGDDLRLDCRQSESSSSDSQPKMNVSRQQIQSSSTEHLEYDTSADEPLTSCVSEIESSSSANNIDSTTDETNQPSVFSKLRVKRLEGNPFTLEDLDESMTIEDIKKKIDDKIGWDVAQQRIIYRGKVLQNDQTALDCKLENDGWIHVVTQLPRSEEVQASSPATQASLSSPSLLQTQDHRLEDLVTSISDQINALGSQTGSQNMFEGFQPAALPSNPRSGGRSTRNGGGRIPRRNPLLNESCVEHIHQSIATIETLVGNAYDCLEDPSHEHLEQDDDFILPLALDTLLDDLDDDPNPRGNKFTTDMGEMDLSLEHDSISHGSNVDRKRKFVEGQWIDVLDTVNQWLEATVMKVSSDGRKVHIHYNAWGERWDEVLDVNSDRIAPFRTKTRQHGSCRNASATAAAWVAQAPTIAGESNESNLRAVMPKVYNTIENVLMPMFRDAAKGIQDESESEKSLGQIIHIAPVLDRVGRMLTDMAQQLANRPRFKRRIAVLRITNCQSLINLLNQSALPLGLKLPEGSNDSHHSPRGERDEAIERRGWDASFLELMQDSDGSRSGRRGNVDVVIHAIVTPAAQNV